MIMVDDGADAAYDFRSSAREEEFGFGMFVERILFAVHELLPVHEERRNPLRVIFVDVPGELDKGKSVAFGRDRRYSDCIHRREQRMFT